MIRFQIMDLPIIFMFSGQGSQYYQMGRSLYDNGGVFARLMDQMDNIVRVKTGRSVVQELYGNHSRSSSFDDIMLTNPAIFMVEFSLANHLISLGIKPHMTLGASLGAYAAAAVAGCISMEDTLALVIDHAACIVSHCPKGGMLTVLSSMSPSSGQVAIGDYVTIAGRNFPGHYVVSGLTDDLKRAEAVLRSEGIVCQRLPTHYPFHSQWIDSAKMPFLGISQRTSYKSAEISMCSCSEKKICTSLDPEYFWNVIRQPIEFQETIEWLETTGGFHYIDVGPSATLSTFLKYVLSPATMSKSSAVMTPYGNDLKNLDKLLSTGSPIRAGSRNVRASSSIQ